MTLIREIGTLLVKTFLVTLAVALGFSLGGAMCLPSWMLGFVLIPAGYLFFRLNGEAPAPVRKWLPPLLNLTLLLLLFELVIPRIPKGWQTAAFFGLVMLAPHWMKLFQPRIPSENQPRT